MNGIEREWLDVELVTIIYRMAIGLAVLSAASSVCFFSLRHIAGDGFHEGIAAMFIVGLVLTATTVPWVFLNGYWLVILKTSPNIYSQKYMPTEMQAK